MDGWERGDERNAHFRLHPSSVIFWHCGFTAGGGGALSTISGLKLISRIVSHRQRGGPYQILRSRQCATLSPEASWLVYMFLAGVLLKAPRFCVSVKDSSSWFGQVVQCNKMHILLLHFTYNVLLNLLASPEHPATILTLVVVTS